MLRNYVALVIDSSSSMWSIRTAAVQAFNGILNSLRKTPTGQETQVLLIEFSDYASVISYPTDIQNVRDLRHADYTPHGNTALFDAAVLAIETLEKVPDANQPNVSFLVFVFTDGEENVSRRTTEGKLKSLIERVQKTDRWSIGFLVPPGRRNRAVNFGLPQANVKEWEATTDGVKEMEVHTAGAVQGYYQARSSGQTRSKSLFMDLSQVNMDQVRATLTDLSKSFKSWTVDKETDIRPFVEYHTGKPYVTGQAYYQLTDNRGVKVQPHKSVLLIEKGKKAIYGGADARRLIGLPDGETVRVKPGNHANFDIFIQSTSVNRRLIKGTKVLVDISKTVSDPLTWDPDPVHA